MDVIAAGPPCQSFSSAGPHRGWTSNTSHVFPAVMRHVQHLHRQRLTPVSYILENVPAAASFPHLSDSLGPPPVGHAELHGSALRRSTALWTNIGARAPTQKLLDTPSATWTAADLLRDTAFGIDYTSSDLLRFFNKFMRRPDSHAHRQHRNGRIGPMRLHYLHSSGSAEPPSSLREISMGYIMGDNAAPGLTEFQRCALLGSAINQNPATALIRILSDAPQPSCCMACILGSRCQFDGLCDSLDCSSSTRPLAVLNASAAKSDPPAPVPADLPFTLCDCTEGADSMLICDSCERGF